MSYFLATRSGHEIKITSEQRERVNNARRMGRKEITVNGNDLLVSDIAGIFDHPKQRYGQFFCEFEVWHSDKETCECAAIERERRQMEQAITTPERVLKAGPRCQGKHSISLLISKMIRQEYGKEWPKPMRDRELRERMRQEIRKRDPIMKWCDTRLNECACEESDTPELTLKDVFPDVKQIMFGGE